MFLTMKKHLALQELPVLEVQVALWQLPKATFALQCNLYSGKASHSFGPNPNPNHNGHCCLREHCNAASQSEFGAECASRMLSCSNEVSPELMKAWKAIGCAEVGRVQALEADLCSRMSPSFSDTAIMIPDIR